MPQEQHDIKTRILLAAKKLFAQQGFEGTTVRQICDEAGGNVALVSYHFGGKDNVFQAIFDEFFPGKRLNEYESFFQDPVVGLKFIIEGILTFFSQDFELSTIINQELSMQSPRSTMIQGYILPVWGKIREMLETGREQGIFHFESIDFAFMMTMGTIIYPNQFQNYCLATLNINTEEQIQKKIEATIEFVLGGLKYQAKS